MGWRERDWARWSREERRRFLGAGAPSAAPRAHRSRTGARTATATRIHPLTLVAFALVVVLALGQLPRHHPLVPSLHFRLPAGHGQAGPSYELSTPLIRRLDAPRTARVGSVLTFHGRLPSGTTGAVLLEGTYGGRWRVLAGDQASDGSYSTRMIVPRRGLLHLRLIYPDGTRWVAAVLVR